MNRSLLEIALQMLSGNKLEDHIVKMKIDYPQRGPNKGKRILTVQARIILNPNEAQK